MGKNEVRAGQLRQVSGWSFEGWSYESASHGDLYMVLSRRNSLGCCEILVNGKTFAVQESFIRNDELVSEEPNG